MPTTGVDPSMADLLESAAHNLRGPASRIGLVSQLLNRNVASLDADARKLLQYVEESANAVGVVAAGLNRYAELCARPLEREPIDLGIPAAAAIDGLRDEIANAQAQVACSALPTAPVDRLLMTWLFQELLSNAIRVRSEGSREVRISSAVGGPGGWYVAVSDNGPGIEPGMAERVFRPFKKLSPGGGSGLGLTICRKIIELHGGAIWIEPGCPGAEFRFFVSQEDGGR
jgi:signal transduction histidine kinase